MIVISSHAILEFGHWRVGVIEHDDCWREDTISKKYHPNLDEPKPNRFKLSPNNRIPRLPLIIL